MFSNACVFKACAPIQEVEGIFQGHSKRFKKKFLCCQHQGQTANALRSENSECTSVIPPHFTSLGETGQGEPSWAGATGTGSSSRLALCSPLAPTPGLLTARREETSHKCHPKIPIPVPGQRPGTAGPRYLHRLVLGFVPRAAVPCPLPVTGPELGWDEGWDAPQGCCSPASHGNVGL